MIFKFSPMAPRPFMLPKMQMTAQGPRMVGKRYVAPQNFQLNQQPASTETSGWATLDSDSDDDKKDVKKEKLPMCRLIIPPFKRVPRGTNGGVSLVGFVAAALAGAWIAFCVLIGLWWTEGIVLNEEDGKLTAKVLFLSLAITGTVI